jgi:raffinose/stachyose/melibiose transport system substrate-binding protein
VIRNGRWGRVAAVTACLCLAMTSAATAGPARQTHAKAQKITLTMWWWGDQEASGAKAFVADSVKKYEALHPNITINTTLQSTDNLVPAFEAAAAAKKGPDIEYFWGGINTLEDGWAGNITPISTLLPKSETKHYINASEDTSGGKLYSAPWYIQPSFPVLYRKDVLKKAGIAAAPTTWAQLISDCKTLRAKGITPIAGGVKDGWFGGWLYSILGSQSVKSVNDVKAAVVGTQKFTDPDQAAWWTRLEQMKTADCWNDDIGSLGLYQAQQTWVEGKSAMTITAGTDVKKFVKEVGQSKVGVMAMPVYAHGIGAGKLGATSQTLGVTSFSKYPKEAAAFIEYLHTPDRLTAFYNATGALPADDRFNANLIKIPQIKQLFTMAKAGGPYLENFIPAELDSTGNFQGVQNLLAGKWTPTQAAAAMESEMARIRLTNPKEIANFKAWGAQ